VTHFGEPAVLPCAAETHLEAASEVTQVLHGPLQYFANTACHISGDAVATSICYCDFIT
jgi:hypothetical protein